MNTLIAIILFGVFLFLSAVHVYWALGGRWGSEAVFPTKDEETRGVMPGILPTLIVAAGLFSFGLLVLIKGSLLKVHLPQWLDHYGLWLLSGIFILRAIGEFNYVGFFKRYRKTAFARNDTRLYSPLSLLIGLLLLLLQWYSQ